MRPQYSQTESGQTIIEYAVILFLISAVTIAGLTFAGPQVGGVFSQIHGRIQDAVLGEGSATPVVMVTPTPEGTGIPTPSASPSATPTPSRPRQEPTPTLTMDGVRPRDPTPTPTPTSAPRVGLAAYYAMDELNWSDRANGVQDSSGNGLHGTARNGAGIATNSPAMPGNPGTCGYGVFDGLNDSVTVAHNEVLELTDAVTLMAWVRCDQHETAEIVTKGKASWRDGYTLSLDKWQGWSFTVQTTAGGQTVRLGSVPDTGWHHVAGVFNGTFVILYVDGAAVAQRRFPSTQISWHPTSKTDLMISPEYKPFGGNIDEVRIYGQVLSPGDIVGVMRATHPCSFALTCIDYNITLQARGSTSPFGISAKGG